MNKETKDTAIRLIVIGLMVACLLCGLILGGTAPRPEEREYCEKYWDSYAKEYIVENDCSSLEIRNSIGRQLQCKQKERTIIVGDE